MPEDMIGGLLLMVCVCHSMPCLFLLPLCLCPFSFNYMRIMNDPPSFMGPLLPKAQGLGGTPRNW